MEPAGIDTSTTTPYASPTATRPRQHVMYSAIVLHSSQKDCSYASEFLYLSTNNYCGAFDRTSLQEEGERNGAAFRFLNGTDLTLQIPLRMTYTTRPSQDLSDQ
uniref:Uncharacterized protein n=1 Tax=Heterorhabditis bacteriophora TaxID=37862 RepID=A0A1I7XNI4_HETBA